MNCIFCQNLMASFYQDNLIMECNQCNLSYYKNSHINIRLKGINHYRNPYFQLDMSSSSASRIIGSKGETLAEWNHRVNINPSNISDKLKLYITFS